MPDDAILPSAAASPHYSGNASGRRGGWFRWAIVVWGVFIGWQLWRANEFLAAVQGNSKQHQFWMLCHSGGTDAMRSRAFLQLVDAGNDEWRSAQMERLPLRGARLDGASLQHANFQSSDLSRASLVEARLQNANLQLVDLSEANFEKAEMAGASLMKSVLEKANFRLAKMQGAILQQARATEADFLVTDLSEADLLMADLTRANLAGANLTGARLRSATLKEAVLTFTDLTDANLDNIDLTDSNWWRARGLAAAQLEELCVLFPPGDDAPQPLRDDFRQWLQSMKTIEP